eukprot:6212355-Pleurochrysis_carterae.AAC.1
MTLVAQTGSGAVTDHDLDASVKDQWLQRNASGALTGVTGNASGTLTGSETFPSLVLGVAIHPRPWRVEYLP